MSDCLAYYSACHEPTDHNIARARAYCTGRPCPPLKHGWRVTALSLATPMGHLGVHGQDLNSTLNHVMFETVVKLYQRQPSVKLYRAGADGHQHLYHRMDGVLEPFLARHWPQYFLAGVQINVHVSD